MIVKKWEHYGVISVNSIKKQTNAAQVLVPVTKRCLVAGTSLVCVGHLYTNSDGEIINLYIETPVPMWEFVFYRNQKDAVVIPATFMDRELQKKSFYRVVQFKDKYMWIERAATVAKVGKPFQNNIFLLVYEDEK